MKLRSILVLALALVCAPAFAQVNPGTSPLSGAKGGTNNAFMQFTGPASSLKTFTLPNVSDTLGALGQIQTWTGQQTFVAPILGTPASATLTNATGLPVGTGITGLGTGVATALGNPLNAASGLVGYSGQLGAASASSLSVAGASTLTGGVNIGAGVGVITTGYSNTKMVFSGGTAGLQFNNQTNSAVLGVLDNSGKLGIGASGAPTALLDVEGTARIRSLTAGCVSSDATGNLSSTACGNQFNVISAGADPTGVADSTPAFQSAVNSMQAAANPAGVFIPCGTYKLNSSVVAANGNFAVFGQNKSCVIINVNFAGAAFAINNTTAINYGAFENLTCQAPATGAVCLKFNGSTANAFIKQWVIARLRCFGLTICIHNARTVSVSGEAQFDWNHFFDIQVGYGATPAQYAFASDTGSGTGNVYDGMNLIVNTAGLYWAGGASYNIGDITIANIQFGGATNAIYGGATALYKARITVSNIQCDAGVVTCLNLQSYDHNQYIGVTRSGTATNSLGTPTSQYCGSLAC